MIGNPWLDAIATGVITTVAGFVTRSLITPKPPKTTREFYRCGGFTIEEANESVKDHAELGFIPMSAPVKVHETFGRDLCFNCFYENSDPDTIKTDPDDDPECPECGYELDCDRNELTSYTVELYRDVPS